MNLILRALFLRWLNKLSRTSHAITAPSTLTFRALPHDLALRDHLPNFRYLSFFELGREDIFQKANMSASARSFGRLLAAQDITYLRQIRPLQKFETHSEIIGWDNKYCYFLHRIYCDNQFTTVALAKEAFIQHQQVIAPGEVFKIPSPPLHEALDKWRELQGAVRLLSSQ